MLTSKDVFIAVALTVLMLIIVSTCFPAYWLSTSKIAADLKGSQSAGHYTSIGRILLIVQFVISIICITATLTVNNQLDYIHHNSLGINRKDLAVITMPENLKVQQMQTLKQELKTIAGVENVSNGSFRIGGGYWKDWYTVEDGNETRTVELYEVFSDDDLFNTLGMKLISGRTFNAGLPADSGAAFVINETAARELGWEHPVGKHIFTHPEEKGRWDGTVVGVVADVNIKSLHEKIQPLVMRLPWQNKYPEYFIYIRIKGPMKETLLEIEKKYKNVLPAYPLELDFVDDYYNEQYDKENRAYASLQFATVIIILVSSFGILSLSIYMSIKRRKEFGIRKVLGATVKQIAWLQVSHFFKLTLIANLIALPAAYWLMKEWLEDFAYHTELSSLMFLSVLIISLMLVIISGGYSAWKSGSRNPIDVINVQ